LAAEAFPWDTASKYLVRDNDRAFGAAFKARVWAMGIRDRPTSFRSPWQNGLLGDVPLAGADDPATEKSPHFQIPVEKLLARPSLRTWKSYQQRQRSPQWQSAQTSSQEQ
jgi:hypothetical protein